MGPDLYLRGPSAQSSLTRLALEIIDSTEDEREHIRAWTQAAADTDQVAEDVRRVMRYVSAVVRAVHAQGWRLTDGDHGEALTPTLIP